MVPRRLSAQALKCPVKGAMFVGLARAARRGVKA
jgi:hypothetical protein